METLEDIISELNPNCRIGEYRDRILATSDPPAIDELIEKYERIVEKAEIPVNFGVYSNFLKDLKELGDILCMDIHPDSTIGQWLKRNIKDEVPSDPSAIELLDELIDEYALLKQQTDNWREDLRTEKMKNSLILYNNFIHKLNKLKDKLV